MRSRTFAFAHGFMVPSVGINSGKASRSLCMPYDRDRALRELLAFYQEAGVDALVGERPVNRLADATPPPTESGGPESATVRAQTRSKSAAPAPPRRAGPAH